MFTNLLNAMSLCLQGTVFQKKAKKLIVNKHPDSHSASISKNESESHPYVITDEEFKLKHDFITKAHYVDNRLQKASDQARRGQQKWFVSSQQQDYKSP